MPIRSIAELIRLHLDRVAVPTDESGNQLFSEINPGHISDETTRLTLAEVQTALSALTTISNEILEEAIEIEQHIHNDELWCGAVAVPDENNACESNVSRPYVAVSGNDVWGVAIPVIGRLDNPVKPWQTRFDLHRIAIAAVDNATPWKIRFLYGNGTVAQAITAEYWSETMSIATGIGSNIGAGPSDVRFRRLPVGWNVWAQAWNATNLDTISFFAGVHGYPVRSL